MLYCCHPRIVATFLIIDYTHKQCPYASLVMLSASLAHKRSYDDAFELNVKAVEDAEKTTNRAAARNFEVDLDIHVCSNNIYIFIAALL